MSVQTIQTRTPFPHQTGYVRSIARRFGTFLCFFITCLNVARQRRRLRAMDEQMLKDIGISAVDAYRESTRSFWDIPDQLKPDQQNARFTR